MTDIAKTIEIAVQHHQAGRLEQAEELYQLALQTAPDNAVALHALGVIAHQKQHHDAAVDLIRKAITVNQRIPQFHNTLGLVLEALERFDEAIDAYRQAILLNPNYAEAYNNMGIALQSQGRYAAAIEKCEQAILLKPDYAEAYNTIGYCFDMQGRDEEAINNYTKAVQLSPDYAEAYNHLGTVHSANGRFDEAIENYNRAVQIDPDYAEAHWNLAPSLLVTGRLARGWKEYRWRTSPDLEMMTYPHHYELPRWDGSPFTGKRLLVHYEQGLGDTIHFVRYLPMVKSRGGTVILEVRKPLYRLLQGFDGVDELIEASFGRKPATDFDLHVSLMDLPHIFGTTLETIPADTPYIRPDPAKVEYWRDRLSEPCFKVGITWSGSPIYERNHLRACKLADFAPLSVINDIKLYSLQKGPPANQIEESNGKLSVANLGEQFEDFADTAAAIENLDLIISTDTSVPHLAGAMAKPVWLLLSCASEWRWLLERNDSPWYPTMRLFRQTESQQWGDVFQNVTNELRMLTSKKSIPAFS